jgi:5-dehydro-2-deoxygluconokinase
VEKKMSNSKNISERPIDVLNMGRSCIDLYSNDIGAEFCDIKSFGAYVGGSPTNMAVGGNRLGLTNILLTAVGNDPVADFVLNFLNKEKVITDYIPQKEGFRTSCVILGIQPPDKFPLVYYRDHCADNELNIDDVLAIPIDDCKVFEFAGNNLSKEPSRSATIFAAELSKEKGLSVVLDIDFRPDQWLDARYFGAALRSSLHAVDIVIGTQDEINAAMLTDPNKVNLTHSQISDARVEGDTETHIKTILTMGPKVVIEKCGAEGCRLHEVGKEPVDVPGYPVEITNILGAGDAFGAGFLYGYVRNWDLYKSIKLGNACGAIVVTRHACSYSMPYYDEVMTFVEGRGGL